MPEDNLANSQCHTDLLHIHLNVITPYQKLYWRVVTCLQSVMNSPVCGIKLPENTSLRCVYRKGQNEVASESTCPSVRNVTKPSLGWRKTTVLYIETICASSDDLPYTWDAKQLHCIPTTVIKTCMTLLVSPWTTSIELKPS